MSLQREKPTNGALVWDLPTRLFHWLLLACVAGAFVSQWFYQHIPFIVHEVCGMSALVLIAFRVVWGFVGTQHARFSVFIRGPAVTKAYLQAVLQRQTPAMAGHTPTGGWMILLLLLLVGGQALLGLFSNDETDAAGPLYAWVSHATSNRLSGLHEIIGNLLLAAIGLHVLAVVIYKVIFKEDLVRTLITGWRPGAPASAGIAGHRLWLALLIVAVCAGALAWVIASAPPVPTVLM